MITYKKDDSPGYLYDPQKGKKSKKNKKDKRPGSMSEKKSATPDVGYVNVLMFG